MARSGTGRAKQWALEIFLDRGFGRAVQAIDADIITRRSDPTPESVAGEIALAVGEGIGGSERSSSGSGSGVES